MFCTYKCFVGAVILKTVGKAIYCSISDIFFQFTPKILTDINFSNITWLMKDHVAGSQNRVLN